MPRREPPPSPHNLFDDDDNDDLPTIADENALRRALGDAALPTGRPDEADEATIDASAGRLPQSPRSADGSGSFSVPNVPVPKLPTSPSGAFVARPMPTGDALGETMETNRSAFDAFARPAQPQRPQPQPPPQPEPSYETTQYLISSVQPHPLAKDVQRPPTADVHPLAATMVAPSREAAAAAFQAPRLQPAVVIAPQPVAQPAPAPSAPAKSSSAWLWIVAALVLGLVGAAAFFATR